ncbi:MAG: thiolase family protein [Anaerolineales bacterium]|jgi:acetyl-CoA C-acetyltransferase|nr:thiolase family protein [Anaerolineales bacterium]HUS85206.1 thiolase family protein [Anaerolineales bacterium]
MTKNAREPVILSAARTPSGRFQGGLSSLSATQLGAAVIKAAAERAGLKNLGDIDETLMGNVVSAGLGQAPARQASILAGIPPTVGATTLNKVCGSGLKTGMIAAQAIKAGDGDLFACGGMESMSKAPFLVWARGGELRYGHGQMTDALLLDGLWDSFEDWAMGMAAEWVADEYKVTREAMDQWALDSHLKAVKAIDEGKFKAEIVSLEVPGRKGKITLVEEDETPRRDTSLEMLAKLRPAFTDEGKVTAGNSPGLNDGAAAVIIASREKAEALGIKPMARVVGYAQAAVPPKELFTAPAFAVPKLLEKIGWSLQDIDLIELNEAFAAQVLANGYALADIGWDWDKVNVHGGAIALGHPIGASGARVLTTLLYALLDRGGKRGIASLCLGGGEAVAMAIEME